MGRRKIAEVLARAGPHLGATTVRRMSQENGPDQTPDASGENTQQRSASVIKATHPNHVWEIDLTAVPTQEGFWTMLSPFSWLQR